GPEILYSNPNPKVSYDLLSPQTAINYVQPNQAYTTWTLTQTSSAITSGKQNQFFNYSIQEYPVPYSTSTSDYLSFGIVNASKATASPYFILNYSDNGNKGAAGTAGNITYSSTQLKTVGTITVEKGFTTERGSVVGTITPSELTFSLARSVDEMDFAVTPATTATNTVSGYTICPSASLPGIGVGQSLASCGIQNATIAKVNANVIVASNANYTITGISNIQATPSVTSAAEPVLLKSLPTSPLVVLDSQANPQSNLILIGSGYVNTLSKQLQQANNITISPTSAPIMQAYGTNRILIAGYYANQTTAAANNFIQQLYAQVSS
ncbi:MAG: hypothetical protein ACP5RQ_02030, partial [Candidatus Micrarchaeia archaeon]